MRQELSFLWNRKKKFVYPEKAMGKENVCVER